LVSFQWFSFAYTANNRRIALYLQYALKISVTTMIRFVRLMMVIGGVVPFLCYYVFLALIAGNAFPDFREARRIFGVIAALCRANRGLFCACRITTTAKSATKAKKYENCGMIAAVTRPPVKLPREAMRSFVIMVPPLSSYEVSPYKVFYAFSADTLPNSGQFTDFNEFAHCCIVCTECFRCFSD